MSHVFLDRCHHKLFVRLLSLSPFLVYLLLFHVSSCFFFNLSLSKIVSNCFFFTLQERCSLIACKSFILLLYNVNCNHLLSFRTFHPLHEFINNVHYQIRAIDGLVNLHLDCFYIQFSTKIMLINNLY
jgi:hypothetical protein